MQIFFQIRDNSQEKLIDCWLTTRAEFICLSLHINGALPFASSSTSLESWGHLSILSNFWFFDELWQKCASSSHRCGCSSASQRSHVGFSFEAPCRRLLALPVSGSAPPQTITTQFSTVVMRAATSSAANTGLSISTACTARLLLCRTWVVHADTIQQTSGILTYLHDGHYLCPDNAVKTCGPGRRNALPQSPRQRFARQSEATELETRNQLGAAKRNKRSVQA